MSTSNGHLFLQEKGFPSRNHSFGMIVSSRSLTSIDTIGGLFFDVLIRWTERQPHEEGKQLTGKREEMRMYVNGWVKSIWSLISGQRRGGSILGDQGDLQTKVTRTVDSR